jgi:hypothetical protein
MAEKRFEKIYAQGSLSGVDIWLDHATGVQYLYFWSGSGGGVTPLLGRDGKPVVSPLPEG